MKKENILKVEDLTVSFSRYQKGFHKTSLEVIHSLSLEVNSGEIVAVVGSSGSGKSLLAHAVLQLLPQNAKTKGEILYRGNSLGEKQSRKLLGREISFIPQSVDYLDPLMRVGAQVQGVYGTKERQQMLFQQFGLAQDTQQKYPFQLSGGMARRVLISAALMENAKLMIADEPTPGLSVDLAMDTLKYFRNVADQGAGVLLITHDIDLALQVADRIAVFYAGTILELAPTEDFVKGGQALRHPYSRAFMSALPQNEFQPLAGSQPYAGNLPKGCLFAQRCSLCDEQCKSEDAALMRQVAGGKVRCIHAIDQDRNREIGNRHQAMAGI
ncbi:MAG: ABC transporter ATP-binding protein [Lachnospiraceae bacterium]|nr:ABC transporter ATP-binding protein [Lachnospiraceae bacterium]